MLAMKASNVGPLDGEYGPGLESELGVVGCDGDHERHEGHAVARWHHLPTYRGGNFIAFDRAPEDADVAAWDALFAERFRACPKVTHRHYAWSLARHGWGAREAFVEAGFTVEHTQVLGLDRLEAPPRGPALALDGAPDVRVVTSDEDWSAAFEVQREAGDGTYDDMTRVLLGRYRAIAEAGHGAFYGAWLDGELASCCGVVAVAPGTARFQSVVTSRPFRKRGIATALVAAATQATCADPLVTDVIITADAGSSAERIYRRLGYGPIDEMANLLHV